MTVTVKINKYSTLTIVDRAPEKPVDPDDDDDADGADDDADGGHDGHKGVKTGDEQGFMAWLILGLGAMICGEFAFRKRDED